MQRKRKRYVVQLSNNNLQNTLFNAINAGIDSYNPNWQTGNGGTPGQINLPKFNNPFSNIKIPEVTVKLEPGTQKMIDNGIKILAFSILAHGVFTYIKRK